MLFHVLITLPLLYSALDPLSSYSWLSLAFAFSNPDKSHFLNSKINILFAGYFKGIRKAAYRCASTMGNTASTVFLPLPSTDMIYCFF